MKKIWDLIKEYWLVFFVIIICFGIGGYAYYQWIIFIDLLKQLVAK